VFAAQLGGPLQVPLPLFPSDNWWNTDVSQAPLDPGSAAYINFIGTTRQVHPDMGGTVSPGSVATYGIPYIVVDGAQAKQTVQFLYASESDGVDHTTGQSFPFYPIPEEAITEPHWVEGGDPGNVDKRATNDRHMLLVDKDNNHLYELYNVFHDGSQWLAGSGAFWDMNTNNRRPNGWTSADAAGLQILPGLVRYDEAYGTGPIQHAFRVTVRATNGYVYPASHKAGSSAGALPMGARLRLKASKNISGYLPEIQRIFQAMKTYGLIVADNGSDMYVTGTFDTRWNNNVLNPAFHSLTAADFEVVQLGWQPTPPQLPSLSIADVGVSEGNSGSTNANFTLSLSAPSSQAVSVNYATADGTAAAGSDYASQAGGVSFTPGATSRTVSVTVVGDVIVEPNETFVVNLSGASGATIADSQAVGSILNDDAVTPSKAQILSPPPGSTLPGRRATFTWSKGTGVTLYWLQLGTTPGGSQVYNGPQTTATSAKVNGLPRNGGTVYARLWSLIANVWQYNDSTYTAASARGSGAEAPDGR
jgi:hypothetical protein